MTESAEQSLNRKRVNHASPSRGGIFSPRPSAGMINVLQRDRMGRHYRAIVNARGRSRSEEHTSELQSLMRISYAVFCLKKKKKQHTTRTNTQYTENNNKE